MTPTLRHRVPDAKASSFAPDTTARPAVPAPTPPHLAVDPSVFTDQTLAVPPAAAQQLFGHLHDGPAAPSAAVSAPAATPAVAATAPAATGQQQAGGPQINLADPTGILDQIHTTGAAKGTAKHTGKVGVAASAALAQADLHRVLDTNNLRADFEKVGTEHGVPPALLAAIASRESGGGAALAKDGTGDHHHGYGIMQVDNRHGQHPDRSQGPAGEAHLEQAAGIFDKKLTAVQKNFPNLSPEEQLKTATSEYNGGRGLPGAASDLGTTGGDYGNDTVARAQYYAHHWAE